MIHTLAADARVIPAPLIMAPESITRCVSFWSAAMAAAVAAAGGEPLPVPFSPQPFLDVFLVAVRAGGTVALLPAAEAAAAVVLSTPAGFAPLLAAAAEGVEAVTVEE